VGGKGDVRDKKRVFSGSARIKRIRAGGHRQTRGTYNPIARETRTSGQKGVSKLPPDMRTKRGPMMSRKYMPLDLEILAQIRRMLSASRGRGGKVPPMGGEYAKKSWRSNMEDLGGTVSGGKCPTKAGGISGEALGGWGVGGRGGDKSRIRGIGVWGGESGGGLEKKNGGKDPMKRKDAPKNTGGKRVYAGGVGSPPHTESIGWTGRMYLVIPPEPQVESISLENGISIRN